MGGKKKKKLTRPAQQLWLFNGAADSIPHISNCLCANFCNANSPRGGSEAERGDSCDFGQPVGYAKFIGFCSRDACPARWAGVLPHRSLPKWPWQPGKGDPKQPRLRSRRRLWELRSRIRPKKRRRLEHSAWQRPSRAGEEHGGAAGAKAGGEEGVSKCLRLDNVCKALFAHALCYINVKYRDPYQQS